MSPSFIHIYIYIEFRGPGLDSGSLGSGYRFSSFYTSSLRLLFMNKTYAYVQNG